MDRLNGRLQKVEEKLLTGRIATVSLTDEPEPAEAERRLQEAREQAGPNGTLIIITYQGANYNSLLQESESVHKIKLKWNDGPEPEASE